MAAASVGAVYPSTLRTLILAPRSKRSATVATCESITAACSAVVDDMATEPPGSMKKCGPLILPGLTSTPSPSTKRQPASTAPWSDLYFFLTASSSTRSTRGITKKVRKRSILCRTRTKRATSAGPCRRRRRARGPSPAGCPRAP